MNKRGIHLANVVGRINHYTYFVTRRGRGTITTSDQTMTYTKKFYKTVIIENEIDEAEARKCVVEARINVQGKLDAYEKCSTSTGFLSRIFTIDIPTHWDNSGDFDLLEYARDRMPPEIHFGRR
jgi:hypothetical protein